MKKSKGFTLIELLIVVIVIGILAAIAVPQFRNMRTRARLAEGVAILDMVYKAEALYYADEGKYTDTIPELQNIIPEVGTNAFWTGLGFAVPVVGPNYTAQVTDTAGGIVGVSEIKTFSCTAPYDAFSPCP